MKVYAVLEYGLLYSSCVSKVFSSRESAEKYLDTYCVRYNSDCGGTYWKIPKFTCSNKHTSGKSLPCDVCPKHNEWLNTNKNAPHIFANKEVSCDEHNIMKYNCDSQRYCWCIEEYDVEG